MSSTTPGPPDALRIAHRALTPPGRCAAQVRASPPRPWPWPWVPCRARCAVSALRAGIPRASAPFGRCALRLPGGSLRSPPLPARHARCFLRPHRPRHRHVLLATALRAALVRMLASLALAGCAGCGQRLGSSRPHPVRRRCRLRRPPARAPPGAVASAQVRTAPPPPSAACCARLPAAPAAPSATQSPWRLPSAGFAGVDSPNIDAADSAVPDRRGGIGSHTRRIVDAGCMAPARVLDCPLVSRSFNLPSPPDLPERVIPTWYLVGFGTNTSAKSAGYVTRSLTERTSDRDAGRSALAGIPNRWRTAVASGMTDTDLVSRLPRLCPEAWCRRSSSGW